MAHPVTRRQPDGAVPFGTNRLTCTPSDAILCSRAPKWRNW